MLEELTPTYFAPEEQTDFANYLDDEVEDYFTISQNGRIVGCGGINYQRSQNIAFLSWDIIALDHQGKGLGRQLLNHRIDHIRIQQPTFEVHVRTSQLAYHFYEKRGFKAVRTEKDFWAKGLDMVYMVLSYDHI